MSTSSPRFDFESATMPDAPRELVLASAGSGKTFHLSSRILGLLACGVPSGEILASTFTRKAAGEILERVLLRLAEAVTDPSRLEELNRTAVLKGAPPIEQDDAERLLLELCASLHRLQIGTLDSFFHRVARVFSLDLGLAPGWRVADEPEANALLSATVERTLDRIGHAELAELLRLLTPGEARRGVHIPILETARALQQAVRELDPGAVNPWGFAEGAAGPPGGGTVASLVERLDRLQLPLTKAGTPHANWVKARSALAALIESRDWEGVGESTLVQAALPDGKGKYSGVDLFEPWQGFLEETAAAVGSALRVRYQAEIEARGRLAHAFESAYRELVEQKGLYRFDDIPHFLVGGGEMESGEALYYRLDGRIRHILLDEFQDTSTLQWRALEPLVTEVLSGEDRTRTSVIVADPKQSIYGWRGAEPRLIRSIARTHGLAAASLATSWRTGKPILDAVNRIFENAPASRVVTDDVRAAVAKWMSEFDIHEPAHADRPGFVRVVAAPAEDHAKDVRPGLLRAAAEEVAAIRAAAPGASIGVLCRTRSVLVNMVFELQSRGVPVSEEGGAPLHDAWGVHLILAALRLADGSADRVSRYVIHTSPMREITGLEAWNSDAAADRISSRLRSDLIERGYGIVIDEWVRSLAPALPLRDRGRLERLVELAFHFDAAGGAIRPIEFVRRALQLRVETPGEESVRVMTVHASKGLEFDAVVLPDLERPFVGKGGGRGIDAYAVRSDPAGPVTRILPKVRKPLEPYLEEVAEAAHEARMASLRDELSGLYVALTRARYALHIVVEGGKEGGNTPAALVREGLELPSGGVDSGSPAAVLLGTFGQADWMHSVDGMTHPGPGRRAPAASDGRVTFGARSPARALVHTTPSALVHGGVRSLAELLRKPPEEALRWGTLVHAWLEVIEWLDPDLGAADPELEARLAGVARRLEPGWEPARTRLPGFLDQMERDPLRSLLSAASYPEGSRVERELPFLSRQGAHLLSGIVDRVVLIPGRDGKWERAQVIDFKTDAVRPPDAGPKGDTPSLPDPGSEGDARPRSPAESAADRYRPQLEAYRNAIAERFLIPVERVEGTLCFLNNL